MSILLEAGLGPDSSRLTAQIRCDLQGAATGKLLNLALVEGGIQVKVKRGENGGRTLPHENVVPAFQTVPLKGPGLGLYTLDIPSGTRIEHAAVFAYAQDPETLGILAAARAGFGPAPGMP